MIGTSESLVDNSHVVTHSGIIHVLTICSIKVSDVSILLTVSILASDFTVVLKVPPCTNVDVIATTHSQLFNAYHVSHSLSGTSTAFEILHKNIHSIATINNQIFHINILKRSIRVICL